MITELCMAFGLILYVGTGFFCRFPENFLDYDALSPAHPMHGRHWGILLVEAGVGITVASTILMIITCSLVGDSVIVILEQPTGYGITGLSSF